MSNIIDRIEQNFVQAMKAQDADKTRVLRSLKAALANARIENKSDLNDAQATQVLQKEAKKRKEAIVMYKQAGRGELEKSESDELSVIESFLPQAMPEDELSKIVDEAIKDTGATSPADMGKVMGNVMAQTQGRADGTTVSALVKNKLQ